jgi:Flp pilus assembly pilin Flp
VLTNTEPQCDGRANVSCADNWLDDVRMGWQDAIVGSYAVEAFRALGDLKLLVNDSAGAAENYALHARMVGAFNDAFWVANETLCAGCGYYRDWVDASNVSRTYVYVWQQFAAIEFGIANASQAAAIIASVDALYAEVRAAYNKSAAELFCTPTNFRGLAQADLTLNFDNEYEYGNYENGACFHWHGGLEMLARGRVQGADAAFAHFAPLLAEFDNSRLWAQRYSWLDGGIEGDDVITDSMFALYGGLLGSLNVRVSLFGGVQVLGPAARVLDGANFTIGVGGRDVLIAVRNGTAVVADAAR